MNRYALRLVPPGAPAWGTAGKTLGRFPSLEAALDSGLYSQTTGQVRVVAINDRSWSGFRRLNRRELQELSGLSWRRINRQPTQGERAA